MDPHILTPCLINKPDSFINKSRKTNSVVNILTSCVYNSLSLDSLSFHFNQRNINQGKEPPFSAIRLKTLCVTLLTSRKEKWTCSILLIKCQKISWVNFGNSIEELKFLYIYLYSAISLEKPDKKTTSLKLVKDVIKLLTYV